MLSRIKELCSAQGITIKKLETDLGFSNGLIAKSADLSSSKLQKIAVYFGVSMEYLLDGSYSESYYLSEETAKKAQEIFSNKELSLLFDAARDASPEDIQTVHTMLLALKRKEK